MTDPGLTLIAGPADSGASTEATREPDTGLIGLVMLARFHNIAADTDQLAHDFRESGKNLTVPQILPAMVIEPIFDATPLDAGGIAALLVAKTENAVLLANGNQIADLGGFIRSDGIGGVLGASEQLADVDLASNPFYSEFSDSIPLTEAALALPDIKGAVQVRRLREAASPATPQGAALATQLAAYAGETTRAGQQEKSRHWRDGGRNPANNAWSMAA